MTEPLLRRVPREEMPAPMQAARDALNEATGQPAFVDVMANAPELLQFAMGDFYQKIFYEGRVDIKFKQLARFYLAFAHGCQTCIRLNTKENVELGVTQEQIDSLTTFETGPFSEAEKAVLRFTETMSLTNPSGHMDETLYRDLRAHFDDAEICELGVCMAVIGGMGKLSMVLDLVDRAEACPFAPAEAPAKVLA
ncbi:MAG: carboxymuconolactone decarboxylase family protein [Caulobacterales bacterium]|nr:carboxymuconolactone decarboxylase family protein [Caulobacterales bacterium]